MPHIHTEIWQVLVYWIQADFIRGVTVISKTLFNLPQAHLCSSWDTASEAPVFTWYRQGRRNKENSINWDTEDGRYLQGALDPCVPRDNFMYCDSAPLAPSCLLIASPSPWKIYFFVYHPEFESYLSKLLMESINANGFRANHTSQDGNRIHERMCSFPDSFTLGKIINRKFGKYVWERTSSPISWHWQGFVCPSVNQNLIF